MSRLAAVAVAALAHAAAAGVDTSWYGRATHGAAFRSVLDFGAIGDGVADDTAAIQAAIDDRRGHVNAKAAAIVYLPPGVYLVSDTLIVWAYTHLRGATIAPPTLRLAPRAPGFGNASALKPVIATTAGYNQPTSSRAWWDNSIASNCIFYNELHSFSIDASAPGNEGAVGIYWCVAQQTSIRDVTITLGGAAVGVDMCVSDSYPREGGGGNGGGGTVEDLTVTGGLYALRADSSQWAFRGLRTSGQRAAAVHLQDMIWAFTFADVFAESAPAFLTTGAGMDASSSGVTLLDTRLVNMSGAAAIDLTGRGCPVLLENVSVTGPLLPAAVVAAGGQVWLDAARLDVDRWSGWSGGSAENGLFVDGVNGRSPRAWLPGARTAALPSVPRPWLDDLASPPCNAVADCGAGGNNATDDTAALRACVARCAAVFLPAGVYRISDTLALPAGVALVGEGLSNIYLAAGSAGFGDASTPKPVVDTPDDAAASIVLADISLIAGAGNRGAELLRWRAGRGGLWDVNVNISHDVHIGMHAVGAGGGVLSNVWIWGADHSWWSMEVLTADAADVGFLGESRGPLTAYGLACEHHREAMLALRGAANVALVVFQTEQANPPLPNASATVHLELSRGTTNTTVYGALSCDWWGKVQNLAVVSAVGPAVQLFNIRNRGGNSSITTDGVPLPVVAAGGWFGVLADIMQ